MVAPFLKIASTEKLFEYIKDQILNRLSYFQYRLRGVEKLKLHLVGL